MLSQLSVDKLDDSLDLFKLSSEDTINEVVLVVDSWDIPTSESKDSARNIQARAVSRDNNAD